MTHSRGGTSQLARCRIWWYILCCPPYMVVLGFWAVSLPQKDWHQFLSPFVAQTSFPVQLGGPPQVTAPASWLAAGLVLSPDCRPMLAKLVERSISSHFVKIQYFLMDSDKLVEVHWFSARLTGSPQNEMLSSLAWIHCFLAYAVIHCRNPIT